MLLSARSSSPRTLIARALQLGLGATCLVLAGCASYSGASLAPGKATQTEARALMGAPVAVHPGPPGAAYVESWEYPRGPQGRHTYMARFDARGILVAIDQVLTLKTVAQIRIGQDTGEDVRRLLGRPAFVYATRSGGAWWDYASESAGNGRPYMRLIVTFDNRGIAVDAGEMLDPIEQAPGPFP